MPHQLHAGPLLSPSQTPVTCKTVIDPALRTHYVRGVNHYRRETEWIFLLLEALGESAVDMTRSALKRMSRKPRPYGCTLRPGLETPLWNALAAEIRPLLRRRGEKTLLARELALHRPRIHEFFVKGKCMPDAERTLLLLQWLAGRRAASLRPAKQRRHEALNAPPAVAATAQ